MGIHHWVLAFILTCVLSGCQGEAKSVLNSQDGPPTVPIETTSGTQQQHERMSSKGGRVCPVVYVIDCSGSMMNNFDPLRLQMRRTIGKLQESQLFQIIFFGNEEKPVLMDGPNAELLVATRPNKKRAAVFINDIVPRGSGGGHEAIKLAFRLIKKYENGSIIFLLTDDGFHDSEAIVSSIKKLNTAKKACIYTYQYTSESRPINKILVQIAEDNSGTYLWVDPD